MRIRCKQNAPERMMRVISKSYSFRLSFQWGVRLQRACAAHACQVRGMPRKIDATVAQRRQKSFNCRRLSDTGRKKSFEKRQ